MTRNLTTGLQRGLRQSIAGGLGAGDIFSTASLDLNFARHKRLDPRVTHTRASSGTYVDGDGIIKDAVTNLLLRSEEFDQSPWINSGATITPNAAIAPNGSLSATRVTDTASDTLRVVAGSTGQIKSIYARAVSGSGTVGILGHAAVAKYVLTLTESWQRFDFVIDTAETGGTSIYAVDFRVGTLKDVYIWGAQLEQSSTVGEYVKTTSTINSAPRFDHNPTTGESLGLLVEESRTNSLKYSENLVTSPWQAPVNSTLSLSTELAPDGTATAYKYTATSSPNYLYYLNAGPTTSTTATFSFWVKNISATSVGIGVLDTSPVSWIINPTNAGSNYISEINTNGWTRVERTFTVGSASVHVYPIHGVNDGGELLIWGVQLETGSFPTSYIPTEGSTVTRSADVASITGTNFSSWYNQTEGTVFARAAGTSLSGTNATAYSISDGTTSEEIYSRISSGSLQTIGADNGAAQFVIAGQAVSSQTPYNLALGYQLNNTAVSENGATAALDTSCTLPTVDRLTVGYRAAVSQYFNGTIRRLTYWSTRLSNDTLQTITR